MRWVLVERLRPFVRVARVATCVLNLALLVPAIYVLQLFDRVLVTGDRRALLLLTTIVLLATVLVYVADRLRSGALLSASRMFDRELVPAAIAISRDSLRDTRLLRASLGNPGVLALLDLPWSLLYLGAIVLLHPLLGMAALAGVGLVIFAVAATARLQKCERSDSLSRAGIAEEQANELVRNTETLVAVGMSQTAIATWRERHAPFVLRQQSWELGAAQLGALARAGSVALQIGLLAFGAWLVTGSRLSIASMIAAVLLLARALHPFEQLIGQWPAVTAARSAWLRQNKPSTSTRTSMIVAGTLVRAATGWVDVDGVSYSPSAGRPASIKNVTMALAPGDSILVFGPSGCGKTTLARLLLGVLRPQNGTVRLDGTDPARWDRAQLGECVGYVAQDAQLFPGTVAENIARLGTMDSPRVVQAARLARAHGMIVRMPEGYHTEVGEAGRCLAAGQRWRVALARALYVNPRVLVLDEPNAELVETLAELKARGTTVIILAQSAGLAEHVDRLAILRDGALHVLDRAELPSQATASVVALHRPAPQPL